MGNNGLGMHFYIVKKWCKVSPYCGAKGSDVMAPVFADLGGGIAGGKFGLLPDCNFCQVAWPWEHTVYLNHVKSKCYVMFVYWKEGARISVTCSDQCWFFYPKNAMFCTIDLFCPSQMRSAPHDLSSSLCLFLFVDVIQSCKQFTILIRYESSYCTASYCESLKQFLLIRKYFCYWVEQNILLFHFKFFILPPPLDRDREIHPEGN